MSLRFTVLASGSGGNASLVEADGAGVLIDAGLGPRQLAARLAAACAGWAAVRAVLLTHAHSDHWKDRTLAHLRRRRVALYCHPDCQSVLSLYSPAFAGLAADGLVRSFTPGEEFSPAPGLRCRPLPVRHDGGATFGFRLSGAPDLFGDAPALGYVADLGSWDDALAAALADVDLLAVEFNHDPAMEYASGRSPRLIARVLGDDGHLSNAQGAELVRAVLACSAAGRLRHVVQLHLSRHCNHPDLAREAAHAVLVPGIALHTAEQDAAGATLHLGAACDGPRRKRTSAVPGGRNRRVRRRGAAPWLPGLELEAAEGSAGEGSIA
jgi:phosphoribosyl 1,2-cyclic phosphodiesterase